MSHVGLSNVYKKNNFNVFFMTSKCIMVLVNCENIAVSNGVIIHDI